MSAFGWAAFDGYDSIEAWATAHGYTLDDALGEGVHQQDDAPNGELVCPSCHAYDGLRETSLVSAYSEGYYAAAEDGSIEFVPSGWTITDDFGDASQVTGVDCASCGWRGAPTDLDPSHPGRIHAPFHTL